MQRRWLALSLLSIVLAAGCRDECRRHGGRAGREAAARDNLYVMRKAIDNFFADKRRYPTGLQELVPNYLLEFRWIR